MRKLPFAKHLFNSKREAEIFDVVLREKIERQTAVSGRPDSTRHDHAELSRPNAHLRGKSIVTEGEYTPYILP